MCWEYEVAKCNDEGISYPCMCTDYFWAPLACPEDTVEGFFVDWLYAYLGAEVTDKQKLRTITEEFFSELHHLGIIQPMENENGLVRVTPSARKIQEDDEMCVMRVSEEERDEFLQWRREQRENDD